MGEIKPTEKVQAGGYAGAAAILLLWLLEQQGIILPAPVAAACTLLISGLGAWFKTEGTGWLSLLKSGGGDHVAK